MTFKKDWPLGFLGFMGVRGVPAILSGDWSEAIWLVWFVWFVYFIPIRTPGTTDHSHTASGETDTRHTQD